MALPPFPEWGTDTNFPAGSDDWSGQPLKVEPSSGKKAGGFVPDTDIPAEEVNYQFNAYAQWLQGILSCVTGDGSDGDAVLDGTNTYAGFLSKSGSTYTALRDLYIDDLSITTASTLKMAGYRLYVRGTLTVNASCFLSNDGTDGGIGQGTGTPSTAGAAGPIGSVLGGGIGGTGPAGAAAGNAGTATTASLGGAGGAGGAKGANAGGIGGTVTAPSAALGGARHFTSVTMGYLTGNNAGTATLTGLRGGGGGGGAGCDNVNASGGAGGGGGGLLPIACFQLVNNGSISADGGDGGAGGPGNQPGGGGGGGGVVLLLRGHKSGSGTVTASGGAAGVGSGGSNNGVAGSAGTVIELGLA